MTSHQAKTAQLRQTVRGVLAGFRNISPSSIPYPWSNVKLAEYRNEINEIQSNRRTQEEFRRLGAINPHPHYEIEFVHRDQVRVGNEIIDSNFIANIAVNTPDEYDFVELLNANSSVIQQIIQDERARLGPLKIRMGIVAAMRWLQNYQQGLFEDLLPNEDEGYNYRYGIYFKTRNMPVLPATNVNDTFDFGLMRLTDKIDKYTDLGLGWKFYWIEKIFIKVIQFMSPTGASYISLSLDLANKKGVVNLQNEDNECFK